MRKPAKIVPRTGLMGIVRNFLDKLVPETEYTARDITRILKQKHPDVITLPRVQKALVILRRNPRTRNLCEDSGRRHGANKRVFIWKKTAKLHPTVKKIPVPKGVPKQLRQEDSDSLNALEIGNAVIVTLFNKIDTINKQAEQLAACHDQIQQLQQQVAILEEFETKYKRLVAATPEDATISKAELGLPTNPK